MLSTYQRMQPYGYQQPAAQMGFGSPYYGGLQPSVIGDQLEVPVRGAALPPVCAKCGATHDLRGHFEVLTYVPPAAYLTLFLGLAVGAILIAIMQKKVQVVVPLCTPCFHRWKSARRAWGLALGLPFLVLVAAIALGIALSPGDAAGAVMGIGFSVFFVAIVAAPLIVHFRLVKRGTLSVAFADDFRARLRGVSPALLAAVATWPR